MRGIMTAANGANLRQVFFLANFLLDAGHMVSYS